MFIPSLIIAARFITVILFSVAAVLPAAVKSECNTDGQQQEGEDNDAPQNRPHDLQVLPGNREYQYRQKDGHIVCHCNQTFTHPGTSIRNQAF
jgi:hypothetical protein